MRAARIQEAAIALIAVHIQRRMLQQILAMRLSPLGRADKPWLLAIPSRIDQRALRPPTLLHQLAQRACLFQQSRLPGDRIVRTIHPAIVVIATHNPLVRLGRALHIATTSSTGFVSQLNASFRCTVAGPGPK